MKNVSRERLVVVYSGCMSKSAQRLYVQYIQELNGVSVCVVSELTCNRAEGKNWREELNKFLLAYRSTPHSTTGKSPAELLFRRVLNTKMPELSGLDDEEADMSDHGARDRNTEKKQANKDYVDKKFHAKECDVQEGDLVLLEQKRQNKLSSSNEKQPYEVMTRYGDQVVLRS